MVDYGFATVNTNGELAFDIEMMKRILNLDETCMSLDGGNGNRGGRPNRFPQLGKATSKSALTTTMIGGSNAAGEPIPPHFHFQTSAQTPDAEKGEKVSETIVSESIKKVGSKYKVYSSKGKVMGTYATKALALKRLRAIEYYKEK